MWGHKKNKEINEIFERIHDVEINQSMMQSELKDDRRKAKDFYDYIAFLCKHPEIEIKKVTMDRLPFIIIKVNDGIAGSIYYDIKHAYGSNDISNTSYVNIKVNFRENYEPEGESFKEKTKNYSRLKEQLERFKEFIVQDFAE